jgi:hypothetical protein
MVRGATQGGCGNSDANPLIESDCRRIFSALDSPEIFIRSILMRIGTEAQRQ